MLYPVIDLYRTGSNIRKLRKERKLSVHDICVFMGGSSEQAVYKWESGSGLPTVENLYALSILFQVNMNEIIEEADRASSVVYWQRLESGSSGFGIFKFRSRRLKFNYKLSA